MKKADLDELFAYYSLNTSLSAAELSSADVAIPRDDPALKKLLAWMQRHQVQVIAPKNQAFGSLLRPQPALLSAIGELSLLDQAAISLVGPRIPSAYGIQVMEVFFQKLKHYQLVTVSGGARGIDQLAHRLSLEHQLPTIVVLGGGIKRYWEQSSRSFLQKIVDAGGLVLSEFRLDFKPTRWSFPQRNRIVAGLGKMLFLPEASLQSGSMISVEYAYQMQKPVYSVPNSFFSSQSAGIFQAYQEKKLNFIFDIDRVLEQFFSPISASRLQSLPSSELQRSETQQTLVNLLYQKKQLSIEELLDISGFPYELLLQELSFLELEGKVFQSLPNTYQVV